MNVVKSTLSEYVIFKDRDQKECQLFRYTSRPSDNILFLGRSSCDSMKLDHSAVTDLVRHLQNWLDRGTFEDKPQIVHGVNCPEHAHEDLGPGLSYCHEPGDNRSYVINRHIFCGRCHQSIGIMGSSGPVCCAGIHSHGDDPGHPGTEGPPGIETPVGANYPTPDSGRYVPPHFREDHYAD